MTINVYWTVLEDESLRAVPPISIEKKFFTMKPHIKGNHLAITGQCPAIRNYFKNIYGLSSIYDYRFKIDGQEVTSDMYDQDFFDQHVIIRDTSQKFFSFRQSSVFFTDEKSLEMTSYLYPFLENNDVAKRCIPLTAGFDIGKWFRNIEFPFFLKDEFNEFNVNQGDIYCYIKFNTEEKIRFKEFYATDKIRSFVNLSIKSAHNKSSLYTLKNFYDMAKYKKIILKEINENLL